MNSLQHKIKRKIQRFANQLHVNDFDDHSEGWEKYNGNPVLGDVETGPMFDPFVRIQDNRFIMCVSNRKNGCLEIYESEDGINWEKGKTVLSGIEESTWEKKVNRGCFVKKDSLWYLWYTGQNGFESKIGLAVSSDGVNFERSTPNPILVPENDYEGNSVMNPCVLWDHQENLFKMWYAAGDYYEPDVLCYAESQDGIHWAKHPGPIMTAELSKEYKKYKVGACDILKEDNGKYIAVYIVYQNLDVARIAMAVSENGKDAWEDIYDHPILGPSKGEWDSHAIYKPTICIDNGRSYLWYNGRNDTLERIGLAVKEEIFSDL